MSCELQLQRNTKVFFSTIDLKGSGVAVDMTPSNTYQIEVLAGYAMSQATSTEDIEPLESGTTPDRSSTRFQTSINPVEWNFQVYMRPTGQEDFNPAGGDTTAVSSNVKPIADWYLWQALFSNTAPAGPTITSQSAWANSGIFDTVARASSSNVHAHNSNFGSAQENFLYFKLDNAVYQVSAASVNEATVDASIDSIATTTWTGFGTTLDELTGATRDLAITVFGGTLNDGSTTTANSNHVAVEVTRAFHPWDTYNVAGVDATASFIKNRLSSVTLNHETEAGAISTYTFPVTSLSWTYNNNITYLTPEELNALNNPIGNFTGARQISGSLTAYLRTDTDETGQMLRNILADTRVSHSANANANIQVGGTTAPSVFFDMLATQFSLPVHNIEDIISVNIDYQAQEPASSCGAGGEVIMNVTKS